MTHRSPATARWWTVPPLRQVSFLAGTDPELLGIALDPLPTGAPAVVQLHPTADAPLSNHVDALLDELDRVAVALFPHWLPGAERLDGSGSLANAAARALAEQAAARSPAFGPFLVELAERGLRGDARGRWRFPAEVRAAGLARVIADAYGRESTVLLIVVPDGLTPADERAMTAAAEWLVHHDFTVWLAGAPLRAVDRVRSVAIILPAYLTQLAAEAEPSAEPTAAPATPGAATTEPDLAPVFPADREPTRGGGLAYPPVSGLPRQDSAAEQALERALAAHEWARGRCWNRELEWHVLGRPYRLDLFWADGGLVVEVDGSEHRGRLKYADDRLRDANLQLRGYAVLRFTNEQVLWDVQAVVTKIEQLLSRRRATGAPEMETNLYAER